MRQLHRSTVQKILHFQGTCAHAHAVHHPHDMINKRRINAQVSAADLEQNLKESLEHYLDCSDDPDYVEVSKCIAYAR